ncbi:MAG TPA: helix-turn-helix transcriptional regulator [Candidatus Acidoferrum sp.]
MVTTPKNDPSSAAAIGQRLRWTRKALGCSQTEIADMASMSVQAWNNNERGADRISLDPALRLCRATGISLDWIYQGQTAMLAPKLLADISLQRREEAKPAPTPAVTRKRQRDRTAPYRPQRLP